MMISSGSERITIKPELGCPKGSILSPFRGNILIGGLLQTQSQFSFQTKVIVYADDIVWLTADSDLVKTTKNLKKICVAFARWCDSVKLKINGGKKIFMTFHTKRKPHNVSLNFDNLSILPYDSCVYLGVTIDKNYPGSLSGSL